jgi:hypothetical protein
VIGKKMSKYTFTITVPTDAITLFNWMLKYDGNLRNKPNEIIQKMISVGAKQMYIEGLQNATPLDDDVAESLRQLSYETLKEVMEDE